MAPDSPPPDPKKFSCLEEYEWAVKLHEEFLEKSKGIQRALAETKIEEEFQKEMEKLGYTYHEDEYCESEWCQKRQECLAIVLECFQWSFDKHFFWGMLPEKDKIIRLNLDDHDCEKLPPTWKDSKTKEGRMIGWCFAIEEALMVNNLLDVSFVELTKQESVQKFCRSLYLALHKILFGKKISTKDIQVIIDFLKKNKVLNTKLSQKFLKEFEAILSFSISSKK